MNEPDSDNVELGGNSSSLIHDDDKPVSGTGEETEKEVNDTAKKVKECASEGSGGKDKVQQECMLLKYVIKVNTEMKPVDNKISIEEELESQTKHQVDLEEEEGNQQRDKKQKLELSDSLTKQLVNKEKDERDHELCGQQDEDSCQDPDLNVNQELPQNLSDTEEKKSPVFIRKLVKPKRSLCLSSEESKKLSGIISREDERSVAPNTTGCTGSLISSSEESKRNLSPSTEEGWSLIGSNNVEGKRPLPPSVGNCMKSFGSCDEDSKKSGGPSNEEVKKSVDPYSEESKMHVDQGSEECEEQPDSCSQEGSGSEGPISEERTSVVINTEDTQEQSNVNTSSASGSVESSHDKNNQPSENLEQQQEGVTNDHTTNSLQREEAKLLKCGLTSSESVPGQSQAEIGCEDVECIDILSDNEDSPVASQSETTSKKSPETIIPTVCKSCKSIWNDKVLRTIFLGTESVTVNSRITYGAIISINNWAESHFGSEKESAVRGLLERADLGENIGSLKISEVNNWLGSLMKTDKIKCCDVFVAVYKENPEDELLSSLIASDLATAETPADCKKRTALVTTEEEAPVTKKMVKELPETNPQAESNQIPKQAVKDNLSSLKKHPSSSSRYSSNSSNDSDSSSEKMLPDMWDIPLFTRRKKSRNIIKRTHAPCSQTNDASTSKHTSKKDQMGSLETPPKQTFQFVSEENNLSDSEECKSLESEEATSSNKTSLLPSKETSLPVSEKPVQLRKNNDTPSICKTTSPSALEERSAFSTMSSSQVAQEEKAPAGMKDLLFHQKKHQGLPSEAVLLPSSTVSSNTIGTPPHTTSGSSETVSTDSSKSAVVSPSKSSMSVNKPLSPSTSSSSLDVHSEGTNSVSDEMKGAVPKARDTKHSKSKEKSMGTSNKQTELSSASLEKQPIVQDASDPSCIKLTHQISETSHDSPGGSSTPVNEAAPLITSAVGQPTGLAVSPCNLPAPCGLQVVPVVSMETGQLAFVQSTPASVIDSDSKMEVGAPALPTPLVPAIPNPVIFAPSTMIADSVQQVPFGNCATEPQQHSVDESSIQEQSLPQQQVSDKEQPHLQLQQSVPSDYLSYREQNSAKIIESNFGEELASSDSDISAEDENRVSVQVEDSSSVNLCMTLGLDVSTLDTYCSSTDVKTITNGVMANNPSERYKFSFSHYSVLKERSALSGFAREAFDLMPFESDNCHPLMPGNKGRERFLTNRELLTLQSICILNAETPDVDLFYRILVQILLTRNRVLLVPNSRTLLLVAEKLRRNFNRAKSKGAYAEFLSQDWDTSSIYTAEDLWLAKLEQPKEPTVRNILSVFCLWKNLDKNIPDLSLSEALHKICRNVSLDNTNNIGMCIKLYARFCSFLYEEKNNNLAEFFLNQPFIGSKTPTSRKVLVDFMAAKFSMDMTNLSSARSLNIAEKEVQGAVQKCLSAEKAVIHSPDARKEEDLRLSIASLKEKLNRYKEVNGLLIQRIKVAEKRKQEVLKRITDSKSKKLIQELNETLTAIHHALDKQNWDSSMEGMESSRKALKLDHSTDIRFPTEVCLRSTLGEDVPQSVKEVIYELLTNEVDVNQVRAVIHTIMNKVAEEEVPSLPSLTWIRNFARLNGFKMKSN